MNDRSEVRHIAWHEQIAVAAAYAAAWEVARYFSFSHWMLAAGIRVACLLLVPRRYWMALVAGEALPVMTNGLMLIPQFGWWYGLFASFPVIIPCIPVMAWLRRRSSVFLADGSVNMLLFGTACLLCALLAAIVNDVMLAGALWPTDPSKSIPYIGLMQAFLTYLLGSYLGALTLAPSLVALRLFVQRRDVRAIWQGTLPRDLLLAGGFLAIAGFGAWRLEGAALMACRIGMVLPVLLVAIRHGWYGAALCGTLASVALATTSVTVRDPAMIQAQAVFAAVLSTILMVASQRLAATMPSPAAAGLAARD